MKLNGELESSLSYFGFSNYCFQHGFRAFKLHHPTSSGPPPSRALHSSTFRLGVSTFYGIRWVVWVDAVTNTAQDELRSGRVLAPAAPRLAVAARLGLVVLPLLPLLLPLRFVVRHGVRGGGPAARSLFEL